ncbi:MAG: hypothetical protein ACRDNE_01710 [Gaiellaceae bacterium]
MGRRVTWVVVSAVAAVAVAATVEALRGEPEARLTPTTTPERPQAARAAPILPISGRDDVRELLEAAGANGVLYLGDRNCRLRTLLLPAVEWRSQPNRPVPCRFTVDAAGGIHPDDVRIEPFSDLRADCHENRIEVFTPLGTSLASYRDACAPAWRYGGSLTFVRHGELVLSIDRHEERVLLTRADLAHALGPGSRLREVAWLDDEVYAANVRRPHETVLAVFRGDELVAPPSFSSPRIDGLRATGRLVAARTATSGPGITFFSHTGRELLTVEDGHSISWAPGGVVAAVATPSLLVFVAPATGERAPLALVATDLEWR